MLDSDHGSLPMSDWLASLACDVELPGSWQDFFGKHGLTATFAGDKRRFPRFHARSKAALKCSQALPSMPRNARWRGIYLKDVSRGGMGFVHSEQLFPRERVRIVLGDGSVRVLEVVHCQRVQSRCYLVGARFLPESDSSAKETPPPTDSASSLSEADAQPASAP